MQTSDNPFEQEWDTPFEVPPFNEIKDEHYMPAFKKGMEENLAEIDAIVNNPEAPTFANTLEELERSCGGGGLLSGTLIATRGLSPQTRVLGVEPLNANDAAESLRKGSIQRLTEIPKTLADGAMTMAVGELTFAYLKQLDGFYEVDEEAMVYWTQWLSHLLKIRLEPTCALPMEGVRQWLKNKATKQRVLVVISGGNVDQQTTRKIWAQDHLDRPPTLSE